MADITIYGHKYSLPNVPKNWVNIDDVEKFEYFKNDVMSPNHQVIAFDTETTGLSRDAEVFSVSFTCSKNGGSEPGFSYFYRFRLLDLEYDEMMLDVIEALFTRETGPPIVCHNASFDLRLVRQTWGIEFTAPVIHDTMLMAIILQLRDADGKHLSSALKVLGRNLLEHTDPWDKLVEDFMHNQKITKASQKETRESFYEIIPDELLYPYACNDTELTYKLYFKLVDMYKDLPHLKAIYRLERQVVVVTSSIEFWGQYLDLDYLKQLEQEVEELLAKYLKDFRKQWGPGFNPRSTKQVGDALTGTDASLGQLGLKVIARTPTGLVQVNAEVLEEYGDKHPIAEKLAVYMKLSTLLSNFITKLQSMAIKQDDGYTIHTSYRQILETGRFSSTQPNLQNLPNDSRGEYRNLLESGKDLSIRRAFIAPKDYLYVKLDYSAFELRLIGNASKDEKFIKIVQADIDMHSWLAQELYADDLDKLRYGVRSLATTVAEHPALGAYPENQLIQTNTLEFKIPPNLDFVKMCEQWDADAETERARTYGLTWKYFAVNSKLNTELKYMRNMVKLASFAIYYGAGPAKIAKIHKMKNQMEASRLRDICFTTFKRVYEWRREIATQAAKTNRIYTMFGRMRLLTIDNYIETTAVNSIIQGTAADILKYALVGIYKILENTKSRIVANIHDEIQLYLHYDELHLIEPIIEIMEKTYLDEFNFPLPMIAEVSAGNSNWADCKDLKKENIVQQLQELCLV